MDDKKKILANNFAADVVGELKKVTWPTRKEAGRLTLAVFAICLIVGVYLGIKTIQKESHNLSNERMNID